MPARAAGLPSIMDKTICNVNEYRQDQEGKRLVNWWLDNKCCLFPCYIHWISNKNFFYHRTNMLFVVLKMWSASHTTIGEISHWLVLVGWGGEWSIPYKYVETSPYQTRFKTLRGSSKGKVQRRQYLIAIGCYKMVTEPDIEQSASENAGPPRGWIVKSHLGWRGEQSIPYKDVETSP